MLDQILIFAAPFVLTGLTHLVIIRLELFRSAAEMPLDFKVTLRKRRLFGQNKTWRGAIVIILGLALWTSVVATLLGSAPAGHRLSLIDFTQISAFAWGSLAGLGWLAAELINSLVKRQLDIPPGGRARGMLGHFFLIFDQIDGVLGVILVTGLLWTPTLDVVLHLLVVGFTFHAFGSYLMLKLASKARVG